MNKLISKKINITGIVQGVGFRPFIYKLAKKYKINGYVLNNSNGVEIIGSGKEESMDLFLKNIKNSPPPKSIIDSIKTESYSANKIFKNFIIKETDKGSESNTQISPDIAVCDDCKKELLDPKNPRYYYPFINCTNCGPRYTIVKDIPYDRINTTMNEFKMCPKCNEEYNDPENRRFHAQPNACHSCGPHLVLFNNLNEKIKTARDSESTKELIITACELLKKGEIIAIKSIGGYNLVCDATNEKTVNELRNKKLRRQKPFAIMTSDISKAKKIAYINKFEEKRMSDSDSPIILLKQKKSNIAKSINPNNKYIGIMLPYAPLHHLIFRHIDFPLVMTSANISDEPIIYKDNDAVNQLKKIASYFIIANREIHTYCDDSVLRIFNKKDYFIRRGRGTAPNPVKLDFNSKYRVLALGAEQKNTICLLKNNFAFISQHIGEINNLKTFLSFKKTIKHLANIFDISPQCIAYDLHPGYFNSQFALDIPEEFNELKKLPLIVIQHHHAHAASCMTENNLKNNAIAVVLDGTGYGTDGTIWGGEILIADYKTFKRAAAFKQALIPGGEVSIKNVWRMGLSYLYEVYKNSWEKHVPRHWENIPKKEMDVIIYQIKNKFNSPITTSMGRLFDGISSLAGGIQKTDYEGQAAIEFEQLIKKKKTGSYDFTFENQNDLFVISYIDVVKQVLSDVKNNVSINLISYKFHKSLVNVLSQVILKISKITGIKDICLSGGCFMNMFLLEKLIISLKQNGLMVYYHKKVPCNDGGISLGQAVIAANLMSII